MIWAIVVPIFLVALAVAYCFGLDTGEQRGRCLEAEGRRADELQRVNTVNQEIDYLYEQAWREIKGQ
jgi:hypothetical protein